MAWSRGYWLVLPCLLAGCHAQRPDVASEAASLTGVDGAIVFREEPEPMDSDPPGEGVLTPAEAIRRALLHDPRIQSSIAKVRIAEADANQSRLLPNPILTIDLRFPLNSGNNTAFEPSLAMDLIAILQKPALTSAADKRLREAASNALVTVLDVMSEVQQTYWSARLTDDQINNAQKRMQLLEQLRDLARKRLDAGDATRLDVLSVNAQVAQARLEVHDLNLVRTQQRLHLARMMNQPRNGAAWELAPLPQTAEAGNAPGEKWIEAALQNRPEVLSKIWELRALGFDLELTNLLPLQGGDLGVHGEHDPQWRVGPVWNTPVPIFDWGQAAREKVKAEAIAARHDLAEQELEVVENVRSAYAEYQLARESLELAAQQILPLQREQFAQAQLAYQAGEADVTTLLLAGNEMQVTMAKVFDLQEKVMVARIKLERSAGGAGVAGRINAVPATQPATSPATKGADQ